MEKWNDGTEMLKDGTVVGSRLSKKIQNFQSKCDLQHLCAEKLSNSLNYKTKCDHQHLCAEELINSLNYAINNLPTYTILQQFTFVNNILIDESQDWVENMYSIYEGFAWYISRKLIPQGTSVFEFLDNPENGKKDNSWIKNRNEPPSYAIHLKFNHTPALQQKITDILIQIRADITAYQSVQAKKEFDVTMLKISTISGGEGGPDPYAKVKITDPKTKEEAIFNCRNIFDFGYVINPVDGGTASVDEDTIAVNYYTKDELLEEQEFLSGRLAKRPQRTGWGWKSNFEGDGWFPDWTQNWTRMTDFEVRAVEYLYRFSPIGTKLRAPM